MSVRELVKAIQVELRSGDVVPSRARELLMTLTSLYGNCLQEVTRTDQAYTTVLAGFLDSETKANRAKIRAEMSEEFKAREEARNTEKIVEKMMQSLNAILRSVQEEMRLAR